MISSSREAWFWSGIAFTALWLSAPAFLDLGCKAGGDFHLNAPGVGWAAGLLLLLLLLLALSCGEGADEIA